MRRDHQAHRLGRHLAGQAFLVQPQGRHRRINLFPQAADHQVRLVCLAALDRAQARRFPHHRKTNGLLQI